MRSIPPVVQAAVGAIGLSLVVVLLLQVPFFAELENYSGDETMRVRYRIDQWVGKSEIDPQIVVAAIDENTLNDLGTWPLPRLVHGQFLKALAPEAPRVVGWDILFTESSGALVNGQPTVSNDDEALVEGAALFPHLVVGSKRGLNTAAPLTDVSAALPTREFTHVTGSPRHLLFSVDATLPIAGLRKESYFGFVDEPGRTRRIMPLVININGHIFPSFDCQLLLQFWGIAPDQVAVNIGRDVVFTKPDGSSVSAPIDDQGCLVLNYRGRLEDFRSMSYSQMGAALVDKRKGVASELVKHLPALKDKLLVVGVSVVGTDAGVTPLDTSSRTSSPLVVAHLNALNNILRHDFLHVVPGWIWIPLYAISVFFLALWMMRLGVINMLLVDLAAGTVLALMAFLLLFFLSTQVPVAMPEIGLILLGVLVPSRGFFGEEREKAKIKGIMQAYLSDKVMQKVLAHPDNLKLGGVKQVITIMFCDIRGFTAYCDERDPQETMDVLNEYMETMTQVVFDHDGTIDKYIGDCIMAFWNAPEPQADHAVKAVQCAMNMRLALEEFKRKRRGTELENFECGIGIHSGEALVGNMGSSLKRNYTAMGSSVNLASRLESLTKKLGERIIFSQDTLDLLEGNFPIIDRGEHTVAGVGRPVHVYAVVAQADYDAAVQASAEVYAAES